MQDLNARRFLEIIKTMLYSNESTIFLNLKKNLLFFVTIVVCASGAFFLWTGYMKNTNTKIAVAPPISLTDSEKKFVANPDNMMAVLSETRSLLAGSSNDQVVLRRTQQQLELATTTFYRNHIDEIALSFYKNGDITSFQKAFEKISEWDIKADITPTYANQLKKIILSRDISPDHDDFRAYAYILGRLNENPKSNSGSLDLDTLNILKAAEKGVLNNPEILLDTAEMQKVFDTLGYLPWRALDMKTMRRIITSESLSSETRYTRAYVTAQMIFGRNALGNRILLKNTLVHEKQIASLSCEANSTAHFYNFYARLAKQPTITENQAFDWFPLDEKLPELTQNKTGILRKWGDPEKAFVGKVEWRQSILTNRLTGYGIHAKGVEPVLGKQLKNLGFVTQIKEFNEMNIVLSLAGNNPALFWYVFNDDPKKGFARLDWTTWEGASRTGYIGEHTGIIVGVELTQWGEISRVGYYEWLSEAITWESWNSLKTKVKYFDTMIVAKAGL